MPHLRTGHSEAATASGPMAEVTASLTALPDSDIRAMATYLASLGTAIRRQRWPCYGSFSAPGPGSRIV
ncbi:hypothetical protein V6L77_01390 [Pannonibacter sp. Pt2-lr]